MKYRFSTLLTLIFLLAFRISATAVELEIIVEVPVSTPDGSQICITGNHDKLGNWSGSGIKMLELGPNLYGTTLDLPNETMLEFKFTRGSFATVEKSSQGYEIKNRKVFVGNNNVTHKCKVEAWADQTGNSSSASSTNITGNYKKLGRISSRFLKPDREVIVWLPPSYGKPAAKGKRYPVIYMHDGGNLFDPGTSFGGIDWGVDEAMDEGIKKGELKEAIVVAIGNTADRMSEYTPFPDPKHKGGNGENYAKFLVEELKPMIDKNFRTLKTRENTFIGGSSLGGLISLYIGISRPQTFSGIIAMSPSIWWSDGGIIKWLLDNNIGGFKGKIWVDMGTREGEEAIAYSRKLAATIKENLPKFKGFIYKEFPGGIHSESSWRQRIHLPLRLFIGTGKK
ncbi:MAG: alpha/beta hydrolase-fold protein [Candidatus Rifleibacteriota bacterium]